MTRSVTILAWVYVRLFLCYSTSVLQCCSVVLGSNRQIKMVLLSRNWTPQLDVDSSDWFQIGFKTGAKWKGTPQFNPLYFGHIRKKNTATRETITHLHIIFKMKPAQCFSLTIQPGGIICLSSPHTSSYCSLLINEKFWMKQEYLMMNILIQIQKQILLIYVFIMLSWKGLKGTNLNARKVEFFYIRCTEPLDQIVKGQKTWPQSSKTPKTG